APLRARLEAAGFRAVNNVVDATNAVMLELGQPLHAFDLAKIAGGEIRVRRAAPGETIATLDGQTRPLDPSDLVIADARRAGAGVLECEVPSHRNDLAVHQDLSEEVARMVGYDQIPTTLPIAVLAPARIPEHNRIADRARDLLAAAGLVEVATFPFVSEAEVV